MTTSGQWMLSLLLVGTAAYAQQPAESLSALRPAWRGIGNTAIELALAAPATGPVERVWYSEDGSRLLARTASGRVFETQDFESWKPASSAQLPADAAATEVDSPPEDPAGRILTVRQAAGRRYALGSNVFRSDDGGRHWLNLTRFRQESIIGGGMHDLAVSPANPDEIAVANEFGVWRSVDGGLSWNGLNRSLPNLRVRRLLAAPAGSRGVTALLDGLGAVEWAPGEKTAWRPVEAAQAPEAVALRLARMRLGTAVSAAASSGEFLYAGAADGRIWVSTDRGQSWRSPWQAGPGAVESIYLDPREPRVALAALSSAPGAGDRLRVFRTINGGLFWDDLTSDLPEGSVHGITADRASGAIYAATGRGVFLTFGDLMAAAPSTRWIALGGNLPEAPAMDVKLDAAGNQLYVAIDGHGVFAAPAPHRFRSPRVVNAADFSQRPAAPGSLLTVLGARVVKAQAGVLDAPVLHASEFESQIQIPFETSGPTTQLSLDGPRRVLTFELPVQAVSPAIFIDPDGTPMLLDGDSGELLDAANPARSHARVQILATGLGKVRPDWPTGRAAPLETPPQVVAPVRAYLDREPVEVTRATLAPGFVGFYLVEVQLPSVVNAGPAELYIQAERQDSNRVRVYIEP